MTDSIKQKMCKVLTLCVEITELGNDCFFKYDGSLDYYFCYHSNGKHKADLFMIAGVISATEYHIEVTIQKLEALKAEWINKGE